MSLAYSFKETISYGFQTSRGAIARTYDNVESARGCPLYGNPMYKLVRITTSTKIEEVV